MNKSTAAFFPWCSVGHAHSPLPAMLIVILTSLYPDNRSLSFSRAASSFAGAHLCRARAYRRALRLLDIFGSLEMNPKTNLLRQTR